MQKYPTQQEEQNDHHSSMASCSWHVQEKQSPNWQAEGLMFFMLLQETPGNCCHWNQRWGHFRRCALKTEVEKMWDIQSRLSCSVVCYRARLPLKCPDTSHSFLSLTSQKPESYWELPHLTEEYFTWNTKLQLFFSLTNTIACISGTQGMLYSRQKLFL